MKNKLFFSFAILFFLIGFVSAANSQGVLQIWRNASSGANVTYLDNNGNINTLGNVSSTNGWFRGLFNWIIGSSSTNYLSFNGSQLNFNETTLNATIHLIGTSDYVPYTGSNKNIVLGAYNLTADTNTFFIDSSSNRIGIGTTSPSANLHIQGASDAILNLWGGSTSKDGIISFGDSSERSRITAGYGSGGGGDITFSTDTTGGTLLDRMYIGNDGNVGIGTTSPTTNLEINGTTGQVQILRSSATGGAYTSYFENTASRGYIGSGKGILTNSLTSSFGVRSQGAFHIGTNGDNVRLTIDTSGNVGIGTTTPTAKLDVNGSLVRFLTGVGDGNGLKIENGNGNGFLIYPNDTGSNSNTVFHTYDSESLDFQIGSTTSKMFINANGNVGIGTTSPINKLHIYQNDTGTGVANGITVEQAGTGDALVQYLLTGQDRWVQGVDNSDSNKFKFASTADLATNAVMTLETTGNVGIGTTSPDALLHIGEDYTVLGGITPRMILSANSNSIQSLHLENNNTGTSAEMRFVTKADDSNYMAFTTPSSTNTGSFFGLTKSTGNFIFSTGGTSRTLALGTLGSSDVIIGTNNAEKMRITSTGNVGIGTTSPNARLAIAGNLSLTGQLVSTVATGTAPLVVSSTTAVTNLNADLLDGQHGTYYMTASTDNWVNVTGDTMTGNLNMTGTSANVILGSNYLSGDGGDEGVFVNSAGNVGIGTTSPSYDLHVNGEIFGNYLSTNRNVFGLERNILFNAQARYNVTQSGGHSFSLTYLFDGEFEPSYTPSGPNLTSPQVVLIEDLPSDHTQVGAWVGWTTRYWPARHFKIEGYDVYGGYNNWRTIVDYSSTTYSGNDFIIKIPVGGAYTKLKFTFYDGTGTDNNVGVSELFFIHPESARPYEGFLPSSMYEGVSGNVGIGTTIPQQRLHVSGNAVINGTLNMDSNKIISLANGTSAQDAVTLSQLQAVNATANLTGGGTTNTLAKWTSAGVLGNSIITESGATAVISGDLKINNDGTNAIIEFAAPTGGNDPSYIIMNESVANTGEMWIVPGDDFDAAATNDKLIVGDYSSNTRRFWIDGSGTTYINNSLGLGVSSPSHRLELASATTAAGGIGFGTDTELYRSAANTLALASGDSLNLVSGAFQVAGTNVITSGRVVQAADGTAAAPSFTFSADTNNGMYRSTTDTIGLSTAGTERILINSAGNVSVDSGTLFVNAANNLVGIGTNTPQNTLNVVGDANITGTLYSGNADFNGGWTNNGVSIINGNVYAKAAYFYNITGLDVTTLKINGSLLPANGFDNTFDIGNSTLRWRNAYLSGNANINGLLTFGSLPANSLNNTYFAANSVNARVIAASSVNTTHIVDGTILAGDIAANAINSTHIATGAIINADIAANAINNTQIVDGTILETDIAQTSSLDNTEIADIYLFNTGDTATGNYSFDSGTLFVDSSSNRVGIGTTSPATALDLSAGSLKTIESGVTETYLESTGLRMKNVYTGTSWARNLVTYENSSGNDYFGIGAYGEAQNFTRAFIGPSYSTPWQTWLPNGNVGIGTNSPETKLHILQSTALGGTLGNSQLAQSLEMETGGSQMFERTWLYRDAAGSDWTTARVHNGIGVDTSYKTPGTDTRVWWERDPLNNIQSWGDSGSTYLTINAGNVGVGITSPGYKLDVGGTGRFTGALTLTGQTDNADGNDRAGSWAYDSNVGLVMKPAADNGATAILFPSIGNNPSDFAYIAYDEDYAEAGVTPGENGALILGAENDGTGSSDHVRVKSRLVVEGDMSSSDPTYVFQVKASNTTSDLFAVNRGGNVSADTSTLFVDASANNVGIGTTTPQAKLDVASGGSTDYGITSTPSAIFGQSDGTTRGYLKLYGKTAGKYGVVQMTTGNLHIDSPATGKLYLNHYADGDIYMGPDGSYLSIIASTDRVGIGTTTPAQTLNVVGTANITGSMIIGNSNITTMANGDVNVW